MCWMNIGCFEGVFHFPNVDSLQLGALWRVRTGAICVWLDEQEKQADDTLENFDESESIFPRAPSNHA